jgi:hypothetical protein
MGGAANIQGEGAVTPASGSGDCGRIVSAGGRVRSLPQNAHRRTPGQDLPRLARCELCRHRPRHRDEAARNRPCRLGWLDSRSRRRPGKMTRSDRLCAGRRTSRIRRPSDQARSPLWLLGQVPAGQVIDPQHRAAEDALAPSNAARRGLGMDQSPGLRPSALRSRRSPPSRRQHRSWWPWRLRRRPLFSSPRGTTDRPGSPRPPDLSGLHRRP